MLICYQILGNLEFRKEKLAPDWKDMILDVILLFKPKFYTINEILLLINEKLLEKLKRLELEHLYEDNRVKDIDLLRNQLKFYEFNENILIKYRNKKYSYYCSKYKIPRKIPTEHKRDIELMDSKGIKKNIKNLIIFIFLSEAVTSISISSKVNGKKSFSIIDTL